MISQEIARQSDSEKKREVAARELASEGCKNRNLTGSLELHRLTAYTAVYRLHDPQHGSLSVRVDLEGGSGFTGKNIAVAKHLMAAGVDIFPPFDLHATRDVNGRSVTVWRWIDGIKEGIENVDPTEAGLALRNMHQTNGRGVEKSTSAQSRWWMARWDAIKQTAASQPDHPLHDPELAGLLDSRVIFGLGHVKHYTYNLWKSTRDRSLLHGDWPANFAYGRHPDRQQKTTMLNDFQHAGVGPRQLDLWMAVSALLLRPGFTRDHYDAFRNSYGKDFPSEWEFRPFGILWTLNRFMWSAECMAAKVDCPDPYDNWDSIVRKVIDHPGGDPIWRETCLELAREKSTHLDVPDSFSHDRWAKNFLPLSGSMI